MLWLLEFTRDGHRFRAELRPEHAPSPGDPGAAPRGFWFVSMDGEPPHQAFEADVRDEDTEEFRRRVVSAASGEPAGPRSEPKDPRRVDAPEQERDDRSGKRPPQQH